MNGRPLIRMSFHYPRKMEAVLPTTTATVTITPNGHQRVQRRLLTPRRPTDEKMVPKAGVEPTPRGLDRSLNHMSQPTVVDCA